MHSFPLSISISLLLLASLHAEAWPQFRGPNGSATSAEDTKLPLVWGEDANLRWKAALPGPGSSSPVFWGDRLFVTCYTGYGTDPREPGQPEELGRQLICLDRKSGKQLWKRSAELSNPEDDYRGYLMEHGYASSTPVTDGENVYAFFGKSGVHAFSIDGEPLWNKAVGKDSSNRRWGSGASPILVGDLLIVNAADEGRALIAFDKRSGDERWRHESEALELAYGTPKVMTTESGASELILAVPNEVWALDLLSGKAKWSVPTDMPGNICPSVVSSGKTIFAFGGYPKKSSVAIRDGKVQWTGKTTTYVPTPLAFGDHLYWVNDSAEVVCMETETGEVITKRRLKDLKGPRERSFYASMIRVGNQLIAVSRKSGTFVFEAKPEMKQLANNRFDDESDFNATPAVAKDSLYLRSNRFLYCIGQ